MEEKKIEGLLLQVIPYLGNQKILKILSSEGILSLICKKKEFPTPFLKAQVVYTSKGKEIHPLKDLSIEDPLDELKTDYFRLSVAGKMARAALKTQKAGGNSQGVYALTYAFFKRLPSFSRPENLLYSFYLKTLLHDGLLTLDPSCSECEKKAVFVGPSGSHCAPHQKPGSFFFTPDEWEILNTLTFSRKFRALEEIHMDNSLKEKIEELFGVFLS